MLTIQPQHCIFRLLKYLSDPEHIFVNNSIPGTGATARTVAFWKSVAGVANLTASENIYMQVHQCLQPDRLFRLQLPIRPWDEY